MHILIIPSWYPSNSHSIEGSFFREQAIALSKKQGIEVGVIAPILTSLRDWRLVLKCKSGIDHELDYGVSTFRSYGVNWFPKMRGFQGTQWHRHGLLLFDRYVEMHGVPDIIHVHSMLNAGLVAYTINQKYKVPYIITEHSSAFARGLITNKQTEKIKLIATNASRRFAVSSNFVNLLESLPEMRILSWEVMPNIVNSNLFSKPFLKKKNGDFVFLNICLQSPNKMVDLLINAFAKAYKGIPGFYLHLGGDGSEHSNLKKLARKLKVDKQVKFLGMLSRSEVIEHISEADVFVLSSRYETFGVVIIEALALGKPVIATRCGGPEDIINSENGILVPTDDVDALAKAIQKMHTNYQNYSAVQLRKNCHTRFSESAVTNRLIKVYEDTLSSTPNACSDKK